MTKNTVATLDVRLAILEKDHAELNEAAGGTSACTLELYELHGKLAQRHEELLQLCAELVVRITALEARPAAAPVAGKTAATGALALDKAERVRRIKLLAAQYPQARSFTEAQILEVA